MRNKVIRAVLLDFGGVLAEEGFRNGLQALAAEQGLDTEAMPRAGMRAVYDSGFVLGRGTAGDFWALLRKRTGLSGEDEALTSKILEGFTVRAWMIAVVRQLREQGYVTGILSDQTHWLDSLDEKYRFTHEFDRIFNSYYLGKGKHDPSLFADVAADLGMPPSNIVFIDDDADNVARAHESGMHAIQYIDRENFQTELKRVLSKEY
jgi:putative hydrolase of the HAD superfamily